MAVLTYMGMTQDEALAACESGGGPTAVADCTTSVGTHMVGGVYCDGDIVMTVNAAGQKVTTCVPTGVLAAKTAAIKADCLANCGKDRGATLAEQCVPYCGGGKAYSAPIPIAYIAAGVAAAALVWFYLR